MADSAGAEAISLPYRWSAICAKVARYAERANHPERLMHPVTAGSGPKGSGQFETIAYNAFALVAENLIRAMEKMARNCLAVSLRGHHGPAVTRCATLTRAILPAGRGSTKRLVSRVSDAGWYRCRRQTRRRRA